ncbi:FAD-binding and (Fe-S)-binding domain-containing protein [Magnetospira sp. QH-2]|uniref:FAD-binding and (Fe-S)-binding domain-containing protein n=1 Tax=Magnetospira sp. (strain QH-2) TaxID=1288970 RepID=UPI0003E81640|nr:FAD-binding and (Fe-S)-binding domain-containing protein [Magnetospira sp. QH-2]CCQ74538.1 putative FAD/FMN-containing dehydrogenase, putative iron-sulfur cluster binding protein [Magnetospira sp. QH-2]
MTEALVHALKGVIPEHRLHRDPLRRLAYGTDASFYRLIPEIVVTVQSEQEMIDLLAACRAQGAPITFRAAGTSLSGQAISDSVLAVLGDGWNRAEVLDQGARIRLWPGMIGAEANRRLAPYGRKIGPDPASINAAKIGGIVANNASGMCCGVAQNSYQTLDSVRVVLADGSVFDTRQPSGQRKLLDGLAALCKEVRADPDLVALIRRKYKIKNTMGYSLNALIDFEDPVQILAHLMVGSEGTLGFVSEITYNTVPDEADKASALLFFDNPVLAAECVACLKPTPVAAVELIDRLGIGVAQGRPGMPGFLADLGPEATALLVEVRGNGADDLAHRMDQVRDALDQVATLFPVQFSQDPAVTTSWWNLRKGLFPAVGAVRETGRTVIIEDVAFSIEDLAEGVKRLQALFEKHGYDDALIFGHALEGNLHFVFSQDFNKPEEVARYEGFMAEIADLVAVEFRGSLKAEHGTGRNMAPFLELEWGKQAVSLMRRIKNLFDPQGLLNPGVILNDDGDIHLKNLKPMPAADPIVDKCIECGFCEHMCPSQGLTLTPRQRIVGWRAVADDPQREDLRRRYQYDGLDTCAACGLCRTACPVGINTGTLTRKLRGQSQGTTANKLGAWSAAHYGGLMKSTGVGLSLAGGVQKILGDGAVNALGRAARKISGNRLPLWTDAMPTGGHLPVMERGGGDPVLYIPSCATRTMGPAANDKDGESLPVTLDRLLKRAGYAPVYPDGLADLCCGQPFASKGLARVADEKAAQWTAAVERAKGEDWPVITDAAPCAYRLKTLKDNDLAPLDLVEALHDLLLPRLTIRRREGTVAAHVTCSTTKMGLDRKFLALVEACVEQVVVPSEITCCGFAGDKGFTTPELNAHALRTLADQLPQDCHFGVSSSRTCEIGLSHHAGRPYRSVAWLLDRVTIA